MSDWPDDLSKPIEYLENHFLNLLLDWEQFRTLFERDEDDRYLQMLANDLGYYTLVVRRALVDRLASGLCRLGDPATQGPNKNLSLERIVELAAAREDAQLATELEGYLVAIRLVTEPLREYRNKLLSHLDVEMALEGELALPNQAFYKAFAVVTVFFERLTEHYRGVTKDYAFNRPAGDALQAIILMADAVHFRETDGAEYMRHSAKRRAIWGNPIAK